jgi:hypothetical protein
MGVAFTYYLKDWVEVFDICLKILPGPDKDSLRAELRTEGFRV